MNPSPRLLFFFLRIIILGLVAVVATARAEILIIDNFGDSGPGSLRDLIENAADGDSIQFPAGPPQPLTVTSGPLVITTDITLDASFIPGGLTIDAGGMNGIIEVDGARNVILKNLTLRGGAISAGVGAAINQPDGGSLWIEDCRIENNVCTAEGIFTIFFDGNDGDLVFFMNTTVSGNTSDTGAGVFIRDAQTIIFGSTFSNNTETNNGGIGTGPLAIAREDNSNSSNRIFNTTISGNQSSNGSAGILCLSQDVQDCTISMFQCTITNNSFVTSGGTTLPGEGSINRVELDTGTAGFELANCILSGNFVDGAPGDIATTSIDFGGSNLIGVGGGFTNGEDNNLVGFTNPLLSPLRDNGGPTLTHIPIFGSPAIDRGLEFDFRITFDQRELPRFEGPAADIGSVEGVDASVRIATLRAQIRKEKRKLLKAKRKGDRRAIKKARRKLKRFRTALAVL